MTLRLKALERLAESQSTSARTVLEQEMRSAIDALDGTVSTQFTDSLETIGAVGQAFSAQGVTAVIKFVMRVLDCRGDTLNDSDKALLETAFGVLSRYRYLETASIVAFALPLAANGQADVRLLAQKILESVAKFDLELLFHRGRDTQWIDPQLQTIQVVEGLNSGELRDWSDPIIKMVGLMLSLEVRGARQIAVDQISFDQGSVAPTQAVAEMRQRLHAALERLYRETDSTAVRLHIVSTMTQSVRSPRHRTSSAIAALVAEDAVRVLRAFQSMLPTAAMVVVQKIEASAHRMFQNTVVEAVREAARQVESAISENIDYQHFRVLVGFEGVFGAWTDSPEQEMSYTDTDRLRREQATQFAFSISEENYAVWEKRILDCASVESDDMATFPVFYFFLSQMAQARPDLAIRLIQERTEQLSPFLIPILAALWSGPRQSEARQFIEAWMRIEGDLGAKIRSATVKMFLSTQAIDLPFLEQLLEACRCREEVAGVRNVVEVAIVRHDGPDGVIVQRLLLPALHHLTAVRNCSWVTNIWFRTEAVALIGQLSERGTHTVLENLRFLTVIDHSSEEILRSIGQRSLPLVTRYLISRLEMDPESEERRRFEAVPYAFHELPKVYAEHAASTVSMVREHFETDRSYFRFRGGQLLKGLFPTFPQPFEAQMINLARGGQRADLEFVIAILSNYDANVKLDGAFREIVAAVSSGDPLLDEVAAAMESFGVVSGQYGLAEAYGRKRDEVHAWLSDDRPQVRAFAEEFIKSLERQRGAEIARADESLKLRKLSFEARHHSR